MLGTDTKRCINSARRAQLSHCDGQSCQAPEPLAVNRKPKANDLGKVIRLTAGHQAKVEEKPEVRKAGGKACPPALDLAARTGYIDSVNAR
jgi:hypothetical protein